MPRSFLVKKTEKNKSSDKDRSHSKSNLAGHGYRIVEHVPEVVVTEVVTTTPSITEEEEEHIDIVDPGKDTMTVLDLSTRAEPLVSAVAPYTPHAFQPLAVRLANGYIHDMLATPFYTTLSSEARTPSESDYMMTAETRAMSPGHSVTSSRTPSSPDPAMDLESDDNLSTESDKDPNSPGFQAGVTVGYTYDAFFVSDGRSRRRNALGIPEKNRPRYTCNECGKNYATSSNLSRHKQTHRSVESGNAKKCPHCGKTYVSMPALSMHILTHDLKHRCTVCNKSFSRPWLLQGHLRSHTGEKPFGCAHCGKAFADRSNLRAHMQTHSAYKQYTCKRCDKSFALKSYLNKHYESACFKED